MANFALVVGFLIFGKVFTSPTPQKVDVVSLLDLNNKYFSEKDTRIVNGKPADEGQFPYQAAIYFTRNGGTFFCGGSLISEEWILTAAHCTLNAEEFTIFLGGRTVSNQEPGRIQVKTKTYIAHPDFNSTTLQNDIAVIHLENPVQLNEKIQPIRLPNSAEFIGDNIDLIVSGYGETGEGPGISTNLLYAPLHSVTNQYCQGIFGTTTVYDGVLCGQGETIESTCGGDSGGPLTVISNGQITLAGTVSWVYALGCAEGYPSGFSRTTYFRDWIQEQTGI